MVRRKRRVTRPGSRQLPRLAMETQPLRVMVPRRVKPQVKRQGWPVQQRASLARLPRLSAQLWAKPTALNKRRERPRQMHLPRRPEMLGANMHAEQLLLASLLSPFCPFLTLLAFTALCRQRQTTCPRNATETP